MSKQRTARSWRRSVAAVALTALVAAPLAACGEEPEQSPSAAEQVPALGTQLDRIDQALAGRRFEQARTLLERLTQQVIRAREAGSLDAAAADRILGAISRLRAQLPEPKPEPVPTVTVTPPPRDDDEGDEKDEKDKKAEEARKKAEEARKKAEEERRKQQEERQKDQENDDD